MACSSDEIRIEFIAKGFPPKEGGVQRYNYEYARALANRGHDIKVHVAGSSPPGRELPFECVPLESGSRVRASRSLGASLDAREPDVVLVSRSSRKLGPLTRRLARDRPVALSVHEVRDKHLDRWFFNRFRIRRRYGLGSVHGVLVNSRATGDRVESLGVSSDRIHLVHPGVDTDSFRPDPEAAADLRAEQELGSRPVLLTVARLAPNKGHRLVIDVLPGVIEEVPDLIYLVVGSGDSRPLEERAEELGLRDAVRFTGRVEDVRPYFQAADAFVMPSHPTEDGAAPGEGFGMVYVEAQACGTPVVATCLGGATDAVEDGRTGHAVDPYDSRALRNAIVDLLADPQKAEAFGRNGREFARRFDWSEGVRELEYALRETIARGSG